MIKNIKLNFIFLKVKNVVLLEESPWPIVVSIGIVTLIYGVIGVLHIKNIYYMLIFLGFLIFLYGLFLWVRDVIRESTYLRRVSNLLEYSLRYSMILFIISEIMFFFGFFWAFFHSSLSPSVELGCIWPPKYIGTLSYLDIPLLNTLILLFSGLTVTVSHFSLINGNLIKAKFWLFFTILNGLVFLFFQGLEYYHSTFSIKLGVYGSVFYLTTGFHGFHVFLGVLLLGISLIRMNKLHYTTKDHFSFTAAVWYYHFVDVVWLFLYIFYYYWGS